MHKIKVTNEDGLLDGFLAKLRSNIANRLISATHRKGRILDIGCGTYPFFLLNTKFHEKVAVDKVFQKNKSEHFDKRGIRFINWNIEIEGPLPLDDQYFDIVSMLAVLEHIEPKNLRNVLSEVYRVLKHNGLFIITTPAIWTSALLNSMVKLKLVSAMAIMEHKNKYTPSKIFCLLQEVGFLKEKMRFGYFEIFMNMWVTATK